MSAAVASAPYPLPTSLVLEITERCHHDCLHCFNVWKCPAGYPSGPELTGAEWQALLGRLFDELPLHHVTLSGGEPLLRPDLPELVDFLAARGAGVSLITNGTLLRAEHIERFGPRVGLYELPLLSANAAVHDRLSGYEGAYDRVTEAFADLALHDRPAVAVFVATQHNVGDLRQTVELAVTLGAAALMLNRFNPGGRGASHVAELQLAPAALQALLDEAEALSAQYELPISCSIAMPPCLFDTSRYERLTFGFCAVGTDRAYYTVDPQGRLRPCNHSPTILGDLRRERFRDLLDSAALRDFVAAHPSLCAGCAVEHECLGGCKAAAESCFGAVDVPDPFLAAHADELVPLRPSDAARRIPRES